MTQEQFLLEFMQALKDWLPFTAQVALVLIPLNWIMGLFDHAITRFVSDPFRER